jgi:hypothetical protein
MLCQLVNRIFRKNRKIVNNTYLKALRKDYSEDFIIFYWFTRANPKPDA